MTPTIKGIQQLQEEKEQRNIALRACNHYVKTHSIGRLAWLHPTIFFRWLFINRLRDKSVSAFDFRFYLYLRLSDIRILLTPTITMEIMTNPMTTPTIKGETLQQLQESAKPVKVKYPKVREVLRKLYSNAFKAGANPNGEDGYDHSTAYSEIEPLITQTAEAAYRECAEVARIEENKKLQSESKIKEAKQELEEAKQELEALK